MKHTIRTQPAPGFFHLLFSAALIALGVNILNYAWRTRIAYNESVRTEEWVPIAILFALGFPLFVGWIYGRIVPARSIVIDTLAGRVCIMQRFKVDRELRIDQAKSFQLVRLRSFYSRNKMGPQLREVRLFLSLQFPGANLGTVSIGTHEHGLAVARKIAAVLGVAVPSPVDEPPIRQPRTPAQEQLVRGLMFALGQSISDDAFVAAAIHELVCLNACREPAAQELLRGILGAGGPASKQAAHLALTKTV